VAAAAAAAAASDLAADYSDYYSEDAAADAAATAGAATASAAAAATAVAAAAAAAIPSTAVPATLSSSEGISVAAPAGATAAAAPAVSSEAKERVVIVGLGPSGLFAALALAEAGVPVTVLERGQSVENRGRDIGALLNRRILSPDSNMCYGEGGAGTWSDGRALLFTPAPYCAVRAPLLEETGGLSVFVQNSVHSTDTRPTDFSAFSIYQTPKLGARDLTLSFSK